MPYFKMHLISLYYGLAALLLLPYMFASIMATPSNIDVLKAIINDDSKQIELWIGERQLEATTWIKDYDRTAVPGRRRLAMGMEMEVEMEMEMEMGMVMDFMHYHTVLGWSIYYQRRNILQFLLSHDSENNCPGDSCQINKTCCVFGSVGGDGDGNELSDVVQMKPLECVLTHLGKLEMEMKMGMGMGMVETLEMVLQHPYLDLDAGQNFASTQQLNLLARFEHNADYVKQHIPAALLMLRHGRDGAAVAARTKTMSMEKKSMRKMRKATLGMEMEMEWGYDHSELKRRALSTKRWLHFACVCQGKRFDTLDACVQLHTELKYHEDMSVFARMEASHHACFRFDWRAVFEGHNDVLVAKDEKTLLDDLDKMIDARNHLLTKPMRFVHPIGMSTSYIYICVCVCVSM